MSLRRRSSISRYYKHSLSHELVSSPGELLWRLGDSDRPPKPESPPVPQLRPSPRTWHPEPIGWASVCPLARAALGEPHQAAPVQQRDYKQPQLLCAHYQLNFSASRTESSCVCYLQRIFLSSSCCNCHSTSFSASYWLCPS